MADRADVVFAHAGFERLNFFYNLTISCILVQCKAVHSHSSIAIRFSENYPSTFTVQENVFALNQKSQFSVCSTPAMPVVVLMVCETKARLARSYRI